MDGSESLIAIEARKRRIAGPGCVSAIYRRLWQLGYGLLEGLAAQSDICGPPWHYLIEFDIRLIQIPDRWPSNRNPRIVPPLMADLLSND